MMGKLTTFTEEDHDPIADLLVGHRIVSAKMQTTKLPEYDGYRFDDLADGTLTLDDGTVIYVSGHEGGCSCGAGDYELTHLAAVDNVITSVRFEDDPAGDGDDWIDDDRGRDGHYSIFVYADNREVNIARFEGDDGNGYYGTGYRLHVIAAQHVEG